MSHKTREYGIEEALRNTIRRLRTIVNATPSFISFKDGNGRWLEANDACLELFQLQADDFRGKTDDELADSIHPQGREAFLACMRTTEATWQQRRISRMEQLMPLPEGGTRVYDVIQVPVFAPGGDREGLVVFGRDITECKLAEEALREAHTRLDDIIEFLPDALFVIDSGGKVIAWNKAIEEMTGIPKTQMLGKGNYEYAIPFYGKRRPILIDLALMPDSELDNKDYDFILRTGDTLFAETYVPETYQGKGAYLSGKASRLRDDAGNIVGAIESIHDITERKLAEKALSRSEQQYRELYMKLRDGCAAVDTMGMIVSCNNQFLNMTGYTFKEIQSLTYQDITPEKWHALEHRVIEEQVNVREYSDPYEKEYVRSDGSVFPVEIQTYLERDGDGEPTGYWAIVRDITERKRAEEALRNSEENYRRLFQESKRAAELYHSLLESSADAIVIYDMEGKVQFLSPSFTRIFGWTLEDLIGKPTPFVPEEEKETTMAEIRRVLAGIPCSSFYTKRFDKNGRLLHVTLSASRYDDHDGVPAGMLVILRDVTETKALEAQYRQAQKMEAIGTLAGGIAHDFNNILQAITGYTQLLLWGKAGEDSGRHELTQIQKAGERATQLIRQLLTFSRKVEGERRPLDLNQEVLGIEKVVRRTIPKMIAIELRLGSGLWGIHADPVQIEQILLNLVSNAADAMPDGGKLVIETRNVVLDDDYCRHHLGAVSGNYVLLSATDTGHGMDRETLQHIFEPFFTTKDIGKGTGLGLASVYGIVKGHGGHVQCSSEVGKGATFEIYLPAIGQVDAATGRETDQTSLKGGSETILVVDDETSVRALATQTLQRLGYKVLAAHSGESALAIYRAHKGQVDLVVLDLGMPGMGGHRCLRELIKIDPGARVVIASGYSDGSHEEASLEAGAMGFIGKPYELKDLAAQVRTYLDKKDNA